jgi:hypothetical protein
LGNKEVNDLSGEVRRMHKPLVFGCLILLDFI